MDIDCDAETVVASERTNRTTKSEWLDLSIQALIKDGIDRVKVQIIAKKLGVSRSSFYFFFKDTKDLHGQMIEFWLRKNTSPIIERTTRPSETITQAILNVFECWVDSALFDFELDMAVRFWAKRSKAVKAVVAQEDQKRVDALAVMFARHGYPNEEALVRARVLYLTQIGHYTLEVPESMKARFAHVESYVLTFSGQAVAAAEMDAFRRFARQFHPDI
jgi:AcrR family transcriptional regulator